MPVRQTQAGPKAGAAVDVGTQIAHSPVEVIFPGSFPRKRKEKDGESPSILDFSVSQAIADGASHPLSEFYVDLTAAQVRYPFVTSTTWEAAAAALQLGIDTLQGLGGGILEIPRGEYLVHDIALRELVYLKGSGHGCTTLKLPDGADTYMLKSDQFDTLFPTIAAVTDPTPPAPGSSPDLSMGIWGFGIEGLTLDGNKANNSSGDGLSIYGYNFSLRHLMIHNFPGTGLITGWSNSADFPDWTDAMEVCIHHVKIHDNDDDGWRMNGPHDSTVSDVQCYQNVGKNFWLGRNGDSNFARLHCYGAIADVAARFDEESSLSQCVFESAALVQLQMNAGLNGDCVIFAPPTGSTYANSKGLVIGDPTHNPVNNVRLKVFAFNCQKGLIDTTYAAGGGGNRLELQGFNISATPLVFVNGASTGTYATALAQLIDYDFNLWVNGSGLGFIHMSNFGGVAQNGITVQGPDSSEIGFYTRNTSATSATHPAFAFIRNGSVPTSCQLYGYDGSTFKNFIEGDYTNSLVRLLGAAYPSNPAKGKIIVGLDATTFIVLSAPATGDFLRGKTSDAAGIAWVAPPIDVPSGGTNKTTHTLDAVLLGNGASGLNSIGPGTTHQFLKGVTGSGPTFDTILIGDLAAIGGVTVSSSFTTGVTMSTSTIQYKDWSNNNQSFTGVVSVSTNQESAGFTNGIRTS